MKIQFLLSAILFLGGVLHNQHAAGQSFEKATMQKDNAFKIYTQLKYPSNLSTVGTGGEVVLTVRVHADGTVSDIRVEKATNDDFLDSVIQIKGHIKEKWNAARANGENAESTARLVFMFFREQAWPIDYASRAKKHFKKKKYDEALKDIDLAISKEPYNHELFSLRAGIKKSLGDVQGSESDTMKAARLDKEISLIFHTFTL